LKTLELDRGLQRYGMEAEARAWKAMIRRPASDSLNIELARLEGRSCRVEIAWRSARS